MSFRLPVCRPYRLVLSVVLADLAPIAEVTAATGQQRHGITAAPCGVTMTGNVQPPLPRTFTKVPFCSSW
jgi:hypothetical protein